MVYLQNVKEDGNQLCLVLQFIDYSCLCIQCGEMMVSVLEKRKALRDTIWWHIVVMVSLLSFDLYRLEGRQLIVTVTGM